MLNTVKFSFILIALICFSTVNAQEFNAEVVVDAQQTGKNQLTVFKTLEQQLTEFINRNSWSSYQLENHQKINCSFFIIVKSFNNNQFQASLQVQASRPIYGSDKFSPILNFKDNELSFTYKEFQVFNYSPNSFENNLISVISFYLKTILGLDADSFEELSGNSFFEEANQIVNYSQQRGSGWLISGNANSRAALNRDLLSNNFQEFRQAFYEYHRLGLDQFYSDPDLAKAKIVSALNKVQAVNNRRPNSILVRTFFDAKANEILEIFSGGNPENHEAVKNMLQKVAPIHSRSWRQIKS
ncbi:protein of unknown function [Psychroflexus salarius]|uniref:DUF4835 domain-containing protein n=1 Tax=Psychroflexus salarius TaxID=1155689 RepID=A0A1M4W5J9_9FLAO|nr:DUF4835 family protein [Psychroflexus salarius]SHE76544.1 protein of unknown function [Psychroflexus salarius]